MQAQLDRTESRIASLTWRVGETLGGDPDHMAFGQLIDVAPGPDGRVYALDRLEHRIVVMSDQGTLVRAIGRSGEGPGEFRSAMNLAVSSDGDTLYVFDTRLWRLTAFDTAGALVRMERPELRLGMGQIPQTALGSNGYVFNLAFDGFEKGVRRELRGAQSGRVRGVNNIHVWRDGTWHDLLSVPGLEVFVHGQSVQDVPFAAEPVWTPADAGGFWYADNLRYRVFRHDADGGLRCVLDVPVASIPPSSAEVAAYFDATDGTAPRNVDVREVRARRAGMPMPALQPLVLRLLAEDDGVWVQLRATSPDHQVWHYLHPDRGLTDVVHFPPTFRPSYFRSGSAWGVERDALGVTAAARYDWR